jgi:peptidyl-dipeptidase A
VVGQRAAGERLATMLAMGRSRPWPDALEALTGEREIRPTALLAFFAPLQAWLDRENEGQPIGWS